MHAGTSSSVEAQRKSRSTADSFLGLSERVAGPTLSARKVAVVFAMSVPALAIPLFFLSWLYAQTHSSTDPAVEAGRPFVAGGSRPAALSSSTLENRTVGVLQILGSKGCCKM